MYAAPLNAIITNIAFLILLFQHSEVVFHLIKERIYSFLFILFFRAQRYFLKKFYSTHRFPNRHAHTYNTCVPYMCHLLIAH